jgi:radical SAM superfamily enzyme YgiQ (UPF0313 family)
MKIGLVAMSGIRAHDPKLIELGMTLPGVIEREKVVSSLPSLGLLYIGAVTPPGHDLQYFEVSNAEQLPRELFRCDVVAISTLTAQVFDTYRVCDQLRRSSIRVVLGGLHASVMPQEAIQHADDVVVGEAENVWPHVIGSIEARLPGRIWDASDYPPVDLTQLPVPRYDLLGNRPYQRYPVQTSRGCPWRCDFCASSVMLSRSYRKRPVPQILRDIQEIQKLCQRPFIEFADDNTFVDRQWGKQLCRALIPLQLSWFTETDVSVADDEELLELMYLAKCRQVLIGLESPLPDGLQGIELKSDFKSRRWAGAMNAVRRIQSHGITVNGCFILGLDGQSTGIFQQVLDFAEQVPLYDVQLTVLTPFPGTPLYDRLLSEGRIIEPGRWDLCTLFDVNFQPSHMSADELRAGMYWLAERLYSDEALNRRRRVFHARQTVHARMRCRD